MRRDPFSRLPTRARLWLGCALCVLPLGLVWSVHFGGGPLKIFSTCGVLPGTGPDIISYPTVYCGFVPVPRGPAAVYGVPGSQAPVRVFLVFAALVLAYAAAQRRTAFTRRLVRAATVAMAGTAVLAVPNQVFLASQIGGLALVAPLVWPRPAVFVPAQTAR